MAERNKDLAKKCWKHGSEALAKQNWDLAIQMFFQAAKEDPANLFYRQNLRGAEKKKYGDNGKGAGMSGLKLRSPKSSVKKAKSKKNWDEMDVAAEEGLRINPWDVDLNTAVAEAAAEREYYQVAKFAYNEALQPDPQNKDLLKQYADMLEEMTEYPEALNVWNRLQRLDKDDKDIQRKITHLTTEQMMKRTRGEEAKTSREVMEAASEYDKASGLTPAGVDGPGQDPESDLKRAIRKAPDNPDNYVRLGDLYTKGGKLKQAVAAFRQAADLNSDPAIVERAEDAELAEMRQRVDQAKAKARDLKDEKRMARAKEAESKMNDRHIEVLRERTERHDKNMRHKYDLGLLLLGKKEAQEAIPHLQRAASDTRFEVGARVALGEAFLMDNKRPLAKRQFETALTKIDVQEQPDDFLKAHYALGRLAEAAGDTAEAEKHYGDVLGVDYNYRDANDRLTGLAGS